MFLLQISWELKNWQPVVAPSLPGAELLAGSQRSVDAGSQRSVDAEDNQEVEEPLIDMGLNGDIVEDAVRGIFNSELPGQIYSLEDLMLRADEELEREKNSKQDVSSSGGGLGGTLNISDMLKDSSLQPLSPASPSTSLVTPAPIDTTAAIAKSCSFQTN